MTTEEHQIRNQLKVTDDSFLLLFVTGRVTQTYPLFPALCIFPYIFITFVAWLKNWLEVILNKKKEEFLRHKPF